MGLWPTRAHENPLAMLKLRHAMACPYSGQRGCDFQESPDLIRATRSDGPIPIGPEIEPRFALSKITSFPRKRESTGTGSPLSRGRRHR